MSDFNSVRSRIIQIIFASAFVVIILQLFNLQVLSSKYKLMADDQAIYRKVIYPSRGLIIDRNKKVMLDNTTLFDLVVIPAQLKMGCDTAQLCQILNISEEDFKKRIINAIVKNGRYQTSVFEALLDEKTHAQLAEKLSRFQPAFDLVERPVRKYPYPAGAHIFGYLAEVDPRFLEKHAEEGYRQGDYAGMTGLEFTYEKVLMGQRGIQYWNRDNKNRPTQPYQGGKFDTAAVAGSTLYSSLDIELQALGEKLMTNKVGSIVAIDPKTGGILALVSSPGYNPELLTGNQRRKHFSELYRDPKLPLLNRAVNAWYSPGSTFKTLVGLVGLQEGVITPTTQFSCSGGYYGCGKRMGCLDPGVFELKGAITHSCNTYFANVMQRVLANPAYPNIDSALAAWARYMNAFGLGHKLGVDIPSEKGGLIPTPPYYDKAFGKNRWNFCTIRSISIGQGEVLATPLQVANEMAYLANKGWYITPHLIDSIEGGDKFGLLDKFKEKHTAVTIPEEVFDAVQDGMQGVMESGTGRAAQVEGITVCGKTGTVENFYRGAKQKDHSFFAAFAPRENPKIAIMCVVENAGFGATYAAPIVSLMIEKYLKDSITNPARLAKIEQLYRTSLIPARILAEMHRLDSVAAAKKQQTDQEARRRMKELKDSTGIDEDPDAAPAEPVRKMPGTPAPKQKNTGKTVFYHETLDQRKKWPGSKTNV